MQHSPKAQNLETLTTNDREHLVNAMYSQLQLMLDQHRCELRRVLASSDRRAVRRAGRRVSQLRTALAYLEAGVVVETLPRGAWMVRSVLSTGHIVCRVVERDGIDQWFCACHAGCRCWAAAILNAAETLVLLDDAGFISR